MGVTGPVPPDVPAETPGLHVSERWARWRAQVDLDEYASRWQRLDTEGRSTHGEADLIELLARAVAGPDRTPTVLDAGCGMGRVGAELARRGCHVVGVDLDADLLAYARRDHPDIEWVEADLSTFDLGRRFDVVAMPGNVMIFCRREDVPAIAKRVAAHVEPGGVVVAGFSLTTDPDAATLADHDAAFAAAGLVLDRRFATWDGDPFNPAAAEYAVTIHRRPV
jgi:2-polyprenyl-3-methyl-5-hydroxy-6-metoxy-1,4-benzoquinol methylase